MAEYGEISGAGEKKDRSNKVPIARAKKNIAAEGEVFLKKKRDFDFGVKRETDTFSNGNVSFRKVRSRAPQ